MITDQGTVWYYFNDIYPPTQNGHRPLDPPDWWMRLWEGPRPWGAAEIEVPEAEPADAVRNEGDGLPAENRVD
jgi:Derlin-2/3